jgi:hypothetical protein
MRQAVAREQRAPRTEHFCERKVEPSKKILDELRRAGFHPTGRELGQNAWFNHDLRKSFSRMVLRNNPDPKWLRARIREPVPSGEFYFYQSKPASGRDAYYKFLTSLELELKPVVRVCAAK